MTTTASPTLLTPPADLDRLLRLLASVLAPYLEEELNRPRPSTSASWNAETCAIYADRLSLEVARRALKLFEALEIQGKVSSVELAVLLGTTTPKALGGLLTTSMKRHARTLGLPMPFDGGEGSLPYGGIPTPAREDDAQRTYWVDRDGIARRMATALRRSIAARTPRSSLTRFSVILTHDPLPHMGMGGEYAEALERELQRLEGTTPQHEISKDAVGAIMVVEASDEQQAKDTATQAFKEALERAEIQDAHGNHPTVRVEGVEPLSNPS